MPGVWGGSCSAVFTGSLYCMRASPESGVWGSLTGCDSVQRLTKRKYFIYLKNKLASQLISFNVNSK